MSPNLKAVVLVGHGGVPTDCPHDLVSKLKRLEAQRRKLGHPMTQEEIEADHQIRHWPRTSKTDPYCAGIEALASALKPHLQGARLSIAYNEFCTPTIEEAITVLIQEGTTHISIVPSMLTPGGSHSEIEIPEILDGVRALYPNATIEYVWPFNLKLLAELLATHIKQLQERSTVEVQ